ncbi:MAG: FAD-dependent oxidoreductase [Candidatus Bipolaricaulia bacterium]
MGETDNIIIYGTTWCPDCKQAKQFLGEHRIPYDWIDIEQDPEAMAYVAQVNNGRHTVPTILFPDGDILVEPSNAELAAKLNLKTEAERDFYDLIIVGGGPTGLTAATYTTREGIETLVIEKGGLGGQVGVTQKLDNFPGFEQGISGAELAYRLVEQAKRFGTEILQAQEVVGIHKEGQYCVTTAGGQEYGSNALLIATGSHYRKLNVPGEAELIGMTIHYCATCDGPFYRGKQVLVVGGGNSGFEEGLFLTRFATKVTIVEFLSEVNASQILQEKVASRDDMEVITNHAVQEFIGKDGKIQAVKVQDRASGEVKEWHPDGVFVFIGLTPNSDFVKDQVETDRWGFIVTGENMETNIPGVFAAGDVRAGSTKQAASAAGEGATAALAIRDHLKQL